ncbi:MAG: hypothetical protein J4N79_08780 [Chloroflexi bacterium]|nr:hypothetical protein [Chloroflexota bacterium]
MGPAGIVELEVPPESSSGFGYRFTGPLLEHLRGELRAAVDTNCLGQTATNFNPVQDLNNTPSRDRPATSNAGLTRVKHVLSGVEGCD